MGLLDDLLGQLAGGTAASPREVRLPRSQPPAAAGSGIDMQKVMLALLPVVLGMLANRQRAASAGPGRAATGGGGLGDILGQVLGGSTGGAGALGQILEQFQRAGFGEQARSWVSTGRNQPIEPSALEQVFGRGGLAEIARQAGVSERDASAGLAQLMPEVVDRMTPAGELPDDDSLLASVDSFIARLGAR
jgi:uncharacterized protein YidB (DUF937 family)